MPACKFGEEVAEAIIFNFQGRAAFLANQECAIMASLRVAAADIGVLGFNLVYKSLFHKEIERPVDCRRSNFCTGFAVFLCVPLHVGKDVIGTDRRVTLPDELKHPAAGRSDPDTALRAEPFRRDEGIIQAPAMVMVRFWEAITGMCQGAESILFEAVSPQ